MRFIVHIIMFGMALGMALPLPCGDHPNIWQDDGYGGKIWTVNPDCYKERVTSTTPTPAEGFPLVLPLWGSPNASDSNDTMMEYEAYDEEYVDVEEDAYYELGPFAGAIDVPNFRKVNIDGFCLKR